MLRALLPVVRLLVVAALVTAGLVAAPTPAAAAGPLVPVAHRGYDGWHRESSLVGFGVLVRDGAPWVEADARWTADGHAVIWHDPALWTSCSGPGAGQQVAALSLAQVRATTCAGLPVATLGELVELLEGAATGLYLEAKAGGVPSLVTAVEPLRGRAWIQAKTTAELNTVKAAGLGACYLGRALPDLIGGARANGWGCVIPSAADPNLTAARVSQARGYGVDVVPYGANTTAELTAVCRTGARRVITDWWQRARATSC
jgi:glycerophosphoryl diester phosphodiesterase